MVLSHLVLWMSIIKRHGRKANYQFDTFRTELQMALIELLAILSYAENE